jgi:hypothetical protein
MDLPPHSSLAKSTAYSHHSNSTQSQPKHYWVADQTETGLRAENTTNNPQPPTSSSDPPPPTGQAAATDGSGQLSVMDALTYLDAVKKRFEGRPDVYNGFLDIMKDFKGQVYVVFPCLRAIFQRSRTGSTRPESLRESQHYSTAIQSSFKDSTRSSPSGTASTAQRIRLNQISSPSQLPVVQLDSLPIEPIYITQFRMCPCPRLLFHHRSHSLHNHNHLLYPPLLVRLAQLHP